MKNKTHQKREKRIQKQKDQEVGLWMWCCTNISADCAHLHLTDGVNCSVAFLNAKTNEHCVNGIGRRRKIEANQPKKKVRSHRQ